jgi:NodT family efflux transporter outer membrane factor (OMF) lipoprotein
MALKGLLAASACLLAAGCAVGPDFKRPAAPDVSGYTSAPLTQTASTPDLVGGETQRFTSGADISSDWWTLFHSQPLNDLIDQALKNSHDLKAAQAALAAARETTRAQRGAFLPNVSASFSASRTVQSEALAPTPGDNSLDYSLYTPQVTVSYTPDIFGLTRRTVESARAQEQVARYQMIAAYITLTSNVTAAAIQDASIHAQIEATRQLIDINAKMVDILKLQLAKGYASRLDLAAQEAQLAQAQSALPPLLKQSQQQDSLLAVLTGRFPGQAPPATFELSDLTLPRDLPVSLPSALVAQRPDILAAEAGLHAASAQIGVATANRLPNIVLTGNAGSTGLAINQVFAPGNNFWGVGSAITAPIFQGGTLLHQERAAKALYLQSSEQYRAAVLTAFQNVADTLAALQQDAAALKASGAAADAAKVSLDLSERQWRDGYAGFLAYLTAQQTYQQARISLVQAQANRYADTAALFQALGGGWWRRPELVKD